MSEDLLAICDVIRETAFALHRYLRHGHLEKVYENGLRYRLAKRGLLVEAQQPLRVFDEDGTILGDYYADLLVERKLIIEVKACKGIADEHVAQVLGYLRASRFEHGLLINFGSPKFQIRKFVLSRPETFDVQDWK